VEWRDLMRQKTLLNCLDWEALLEEWQDFVRQKLLENDFLGKAQKFQSGLVSTVKEEEETKDERGSMDLSCSITSEAEARSCATEDVGDTAGSSSRTASEDKDGPSTWGTLSNAQ
jgi:hypothetical protein